MGIYVEPKKEITKPPNLTDTQNRLVIARDWWTLGKMSEGNQKAQTSSYKVGKSWGCNVQHFVHVHLVIV